MTMICINTSGKLIAFAFILLFPVTRIIAEELPVTSNVQASSRLSGKVVDTEGKPIAGFMFMIHPMQIQNGRLQPEGGFLFQLPLEEQPEDKDQPAKPHTMSRVKTDLEGAFSFTNIRPGLVRINAIPKAMLDVLEKVNPNNPPQQIPMRLMQHDRDESEMQILSIRLNKVTFFYPDKPRPFEGPVFELKPGVTIEDTKITVRRPLKIRARIVYVDGTPLANAGADLYTQHRGGEFGGGIGTYRTECLTGPNGYFIHYRYDPGFYTLSIKYKTFSGGVGPFLLKGGVEPENLVIKLDGNPVVAKRPSGNIKEVDDAKTYRSVKDPLGKDDVHIPVLRPPAKKAWVINPANGHAYAKIQCQDWHDAQRKAIDEGAHLVSINDEEEQFWLEVIFGRELFWIGLNDVEKEGVWRWDSGEPVTYTKWTTQDVHQDPSPETERDYVAFTFADGRWQTASPDGVLWRITREAIIEKDGLISTIPAANR